MPIEMTAQHNIEKTIRKYFKKVLNREYLWIDSSKSNVRRLLGDTDTGIVFETEGYFGVVGQVEGLQVPHYKFCIYGRYPEDCSPDEQTIMFKTFNLEAGVQHIISMFTQIYSLEIKYNINHLDKLIDIE